VTRVWGALTAEQGGSERQVGAISERYWSKVKERLEEETRTIWRPMKKILGSVPWLRPIIPATWEVETGSIMV
jgi:hypothetical protein